MPMINEYSNEERRRFLLYGKIGSGKTTQLRTIPGKKFVYMFDPAGRCSLETTDNIWIEEFMPDNLPINVSSLKGVTSSAPDNTKYEAYKKWESDFNSRIMTNFFTKEGFSAICFDSLTTFGDMVMDQVLALSGRLGKSPEISDYGMQANAISRVVRLATSQNCIVVFTGHEQSKQDKLMRTISYDLIVPGQLVTRLPILFSDIYHCRAEREGNQKPKYFVDTVPADLYPTARCSLKLQPTIDVTIPDNAADITQHGLGKILREKGLVK